MFDQSQHKSFNNYLNHVLMKAAQQPPPGDPSGRPPTRIRMHYVHTRERDTFYELPPEKYDILPPSIRATLNPRNKLRVRVTTDQKTGKVLKKIIKTRIADLNIYSPRTPFDWRISVNMEMPYNYDHEGLAPLGGDGNDGDRNKDRLSYKHLCYQIDLTQVTDVGFSIAMVLCIRLTKARRPITRNTSWRWKLMVEKFENTDCSLVRTNLIVMKPSSRDLSIMCAC